MRTSRETTLKLRQHELAAGACTELDVRRAEAELTGSAATLASFACQRISLERARTTLLGRTPAEIATGSLPRVRRRCRRYDSPACSVAMRVLSPI